MLILSLLAAAVALSPGDHHAIISAVGDRLLDSESARWRWPDFRGDAGGYCPWVNAKNSFGAYTGFRQIIILGARQNDGSFLVARVEMGETIPPESIARLCRRWGYETDAPPR